MNMKVNVKESCVSGFQIWSYKVYMMWKNVMLRVPLFLRWNRVNVFG